MEKLKEREDKLQSHQQQAQAEYDTTAYYPGTAPGLLIWHTVAYKRNKWPWNMQIPLLIPFFAISDNVCFIINRRQIRSEVSLVSV